MSTLHLRLEVPCTPEQLSLVALFAAEHGAETWSTDTRGHLVTAIDLDALTDERPPEPPELNVRVGGVLEGDSEAVRRMMDQLSTDLKNAVGHGRKRPSSPPAPPPDVDDQDDEPPIDDTPKLKAFRVGSLRHRIITLLESQDGRWDGGAAALARKVSPNAPASAAAEITKMIKADLLVRHGEGRRVIALTLPGVDDEPTPAPIEPRFERGPVDVEAARQRAAGAL